MKIPEPIKVSSGNYYIRMRLNGANINVTAETATECRNKARLIKAEYKAGKREINLGKRNAEDMTLQQALKEYINKNNDVLSPSTVRGYTFYADNRFPGYRDKRLADINWQRMINDELNVYQRRQSKMHGV